MSKQFFKCEVCGYVHSGNQPPDKCPVCGVGPDQFVPLEVEATPAPPGDERQVVILGAGVAGLTAAEHARETAPGAQITLVHGEPALPYYRLNLTRHLAGEVDEQSLVMQSEAWFDEHDIALKHGTAEQILPRRHLVRLAGGEELPYDRLVLATGAHAFVPPIPGVALPGVLSFRTLEDARALRGLAARCETCVCIGGGLLGLETAGALRAQGMKVTVLEGAPSLLPRQLSRPAARLLRGHLEELGMSVRCDVRVEALEGEERVQRVRLAEGDELPADMVVMSTGVRPNSHLARQCDLTVKTGVVVDDDLLTSDPSIYAAGDVAEHRGAVLGIWPTSFAQGRVAGINAAGGHAQYPGLPPSHKLKVLDVDLYSIGQIRPEDGSYRVHEEEGDGTYRRLVCRDGKLVGAVLFGDTALAGEVRQAVESGVQLKEVDALSGCFEED